MKKTLLALIICSGLAFPFVSTAAGEFSCPRYNLDQQMVLPESAGCGSGEFQTITYPMYLRIVALENRLAVLESENKNLQDQQSYQSKINFEIYSRLSAIETSVKTFAIQIIQVLSTFNKAIAGK